MAAHGRSETMGEPTIPGRLQKQGRERPNEPAHYAKDPAGRWVVTSFGDYARAVRRAAKAMIAAGFKTGDKVCILGFNRPEWTIFDLAAMSAGGAPAGI